MNQNEVNLEELRENLPGARKALKDVALDIPQVGADADIEKRLGPYLSEALLDLAELALAGTEHSGDSFRIPITFADPPDPRTVVLVARSTQEQGDSEEQTPEPDPAQCREDGDLLLREVCNRLPFETRQYIALAMNRDVQNEIAARQREKGESPTKGGWAM